MKTYYFFALTFFLFLGELAAQAPVVPPVIRATNTIERLTYGLGVTNLPGSNMQLMPMNKPQTTGDNYMNKNWNRTSFIMYGAQEPSEGYLTRYDLLGEELDVYVDNGVKVVKAKDLKSFAWVDSLSHYPAFFINAKDFKTEDGVYLKGFLEVITEGSIPLFRHVEAKILEANYNMTLNVGRRDNEIIQHRTLYYMKDNVLYKLPLRMKKILEVFGEHESQMRGYVRKKALRADVQNDIISLFQHYEQTSFNKEGNAGVR